MKIHKKTWLSLMAIVIIGLLSSCIVVDHGHPHHHWHHGDGHPGAHQEIIIR